MKCLNPSVDIVALSSCRNSCFSWSSGSSIWLLLSTDASSDGNASHISWSSRRIHFQKSDSLASNTSEVNLLPENDWVESGRVLGLSSSNSSSSYKLLESASEVHDGVLSTDWVGCELESNGAGSSASAKSSKESSLSACGSSKSSNDSSFAGGSWAAGSSKSSNESSYLAASGGLASCGCSKSSNESSSSTFGASLSLASSFGCSKSSKDSSFTGESCLGASSKSSNESSLLCSTGLVSTGFSKSSKESSFSSFWS